MKKICSRPLMVLLGLLLVCGPAACSKAPEGKVSVTEAEFFIRQDTPHSWSIDAKGTVRNVGEVDLRRVVVTGRCRSCGEVLAQGVWFISDVEKRADQQYIINYLAAGAQEAFSFREVAFLMDQGGNTPTSMPENLEIEIVSFEVAPK
jgi:hypothetical protein